MLGWFGTYFLYCMIIPSNPDKKVLWLTLIPLAITWFVLVVFMFGWVFYLLSYQKVKNNIYASGSQNKKCLLQTAAVFKHISKALIPLVIFCTCNVGWLANVDNFYLRRYIIDYNYRIRICLIMFFLSFITIVIAIVVWMKRMSGCNFKKF